MKLCPTGIIDVHQLGSPSFLRSVYCFVFFFLSSSFEIGERLVNVGGAECPCGGTHVKNTSEIGSITVTKIKKV